MDWEKHIVTSECRDKNSCTALIDTFNKFSLTQLQRTPTREDAVLDLFATNKPGLIKSCRDIPGISDHNAVIIDADIKAQTSKKLPRKVNQWKQAYWATMRDEATAFSKTFPSTSADRSAAENYDQIEKMIKSVLRHIPTKMSRTRIDLPWLSQALKRKCKAKQRLYNRAKKSGKPEHHKHYKEAQKSFQSELKKARWQYINNSLCTSLDEGNHKPFWKYIRSQREDNVGVAPLKEDSRLQASHEAKCNILAKQFKSVFTDDKHDPFSEARLHGPSYPLIRDLHIREEGVQKLLAGIDPSKASGPDEIPCRVLRELASELASVFTCLFRQSLLTGDLPQSWLTAWIAPVYKKGPRCEPGNYSPVSHTVSNKLNFILYADDTTLTSPLCSFTHGAQNDVSHVSSQINSELLNISDWLKVKKLSLNVDKTKYMIFHNYQRVIANEDIPDLQINDKKIERVSCFNFLGLTINEFMNWSSHSAKIANRISRTLGIMNRLKRYLPFSAMKLMYDSLILSHLQFGITYWGFEWNRIFKLQKRALRIMTNSKYNAHTEPLFKELEMLKVKNIFDVQCMKFWYKFVNKSLPEYFGTMFTFNNELYQIETRGQNQLHLFPTRTVSARNVLRHHIPDLLQEYPRAITQRAKTHSIESFVTLLKAYIIESYSYICTDMNCYSCGRNVM